jgi:hypothetical protein
MLVLAMTLALVIAAPSMTTELQDPCMDDESRERVRGLVLDAIDTGLKGQVQKVFEIWMKDTADQPRRAKVGMHEGIDAYVRSRADALKWNPPRCKAERK